MALPRPLPDEFRPWYLLDAAAFLLGAVLPLRGESIDSLADLVEASPFVPVVALASGLFGVLVLRVSLGNVWGYAVEYVNAGGEWSDLPFLVVVGVGLTAAAAVYATTTSLGAAVWAAFWAFVVGAALVGIAVQMAAGYREAS